VGNLGTRRPCHYFLTPGFRETDVFYGWAKFGSTINRPKNVGFSENLVLKIQRKETWSEYMKASKNWKKKTFWACNFNGDIWNLGWYLNTWRHPKNFFANPIISLRLLSTMDNWFSFLFNFNANPLLYLRLLSTMANWYSFLFLRQSHSLLTFTFHCGNLNLQFPNNLLQIQNFLLKNFLLIFKLDIGHRHLLNFHFPAIFLLKLLHIGLKLQ